IQDVKQLKKPKYKWQKYDGTRTLSRQLRSDHGLGPEGEERNAGGEAQLHGYAFDMPSRGVPFVYNREKTIDQFNKFVTTDKSPFNFQITRILIYLHYNMHIENFQGTLKRHTQQAYYQYRVYLMEMFRSFDGCSLDTPNRWNSIYKLLNDAIRYREVLKDLYNEFQSDPNSLITNEHWAFAIVIRDVLASFDNATNIFSFNYYPNIHMAAKGNDIDSISGILFNM
ncbi:putative AC transposase, partial [Bienertia sinuspersici]